MAIYAVDFDGTLAETRFPLIIAPNEKMVAFVKAVKAMGHKVILWTCRAGEDLNNAVEWCRQQGILFDAVNKPLQEQIDRWGNDTRKIYADFYLDDKSMTIRDAERIVGKIIKSAKAEEEQLYATSNTVSRKAKGTWFMESKEIMDFVKTVFKQTKEGVLTWENTSKEVINGGESNCTYMARMNDGKILLKKTLSPVAKGYKYSLHIAAKGCEYYDILPVFRHCGATIDDEAQLGAYEAEIYTLICEQKVKHALDCLLNCPAQEEGSEDESGRKEET